MFKVNLNEIAPSSLPTLQPEYCFKLDDNYKAAWTIAADVDGDGIAEIITARVKEKDDIHSTASVAVYKLNGELKWTWGNPEEGVAALHSDVGCQAIDWNRDGRNHIVVTTADKLVVLNGNDGSEILSFAIPKEASDCIYHIKGETSSEDIILLKNRYWDVWAFNKKGEQLWHVNMPDAYRTSHQPVLVELNNSGRKGLILGCACYDLKGDMIWSLKGQEQDEMLFHGHVDCARVAEIGENEEETEIIFTLCAGAGLICADGNGVIKWVNKGLHFESADMGTLDPEKPDTKSIVVDIDHQTDGKSPLHIYDLKGEQLGEIISERSRQHLNIRWDDSTAERIYMAQPRIVIDGTSGIPMCHLKTEMPENVTFEQTERSAEHALLGDFLYMGFAGDIDGNGVQELIVHTNPGTAVWIFKTPHSIEPKPYTLGTEQNATLY